MSVSAILVTIEKFRAV